jgi:hypothetical protein
MSENNDQITINLGDGDIHFHIRETDAPHAYDGFGTMSIMESKPVRIVLIRAEHLNWQEMRYASGMHYSKRTDFISKEHVADTLRQRLYDATLWEQHEK